MASNAPACSLFAAWVSSVSWFSQAIALVPFFFLLPHSGGQDHHSRTWALPPPPPGQMDPQKRRRSELTLCPPGPVPAAPQHEPDSLALFESVAQEQLDTDSPRWMSVSIVGAVFCVNTADTSRFTRRKTFFIRQPAASRRTQTLAIAVVIKPPVVLLIDPTGTSNLSLLPTESVASYTIWSSSSWWTGNISDFSFPAFLWPAGG